MLYKQRVLALIPARGGSKRLPNKNILPFLGKPLIARSIEHAKQSKFIDEVIVSTDSELIKDVAEQYGASVPFLRPSELASDTSSGSSVIKHCLDFFHQRGEHFDIIIQLQPTSPARDVSDIEGALETYSRLNAKGVVSVSECEHSPLWANVLPENGAMDQFMRPEIMGLRSQDIPKNYRLNGAIYIYDIPEFLSKGGAFYTSDVYAHIMEQSHSVDIDTPLDFKYAEYLLSQKSTA